MSTVDWQSFRSEVERHHRFVLTSHIRPDCDALGSELGMAAVLEALGKEVRIINAQPTPSTLAFIDPQGKIEALGSSLSVSDVLADGFDALLILDTSAWVQLGDMADVVRQTDAQVLILDHHLSEDDLPALSFKNTTAEATGRLVVEAAEVLGVTLDDAAATALFAAIATDTGWFRFSSVTPLTYQIIAKLVAAGASPPGIYGELYEQETLGRMRLRGRALSRIEVEQSGRLAHAYIVRDDFEVTGAVPSDTEDIINQLLKIKGTEVALIFVEQVGGGFKISFRSRCGVDCSQVAALFGGGGHKAAAGAFLEGDLSDLQAQVLQAVREAMHSAGGC